MGHLRLGTGKSGQTQRENVRSKWHDHSMTTRGASAEPGSSLAYRQEFREKVGNPSTEKNF